MDELLPLSHLRKNLVDIGLEDQELVLVTIATNSLRRHYEGRADQYLDLILDVMNERATLVMNCFTWNAFCQRGTFDLQTTMSEVGLASEIFRRMDGVVRSPHPIYSLCARGPLAHTLMRHEASTCWGDGTPFHYIIEANAFCLTLGLPFPETLTLMHRFEELRQVPYRYFKAFEGVANFGSGFQDYSTKFYVRRDLSIPNDFRPAAELLEHRGLLRGQNLRFPTPAAYAKDLQRVSLELLDKNIHIFLDRAEE